MSIIIIVRNRKSREWEMKEMTGETKEKEMEWMEMEEVEEVEVEVEVGFFFYSIGVQGHIQYLWNDSLPPGS